MEKNAVCSFTGHRQIKASHQKGIYPLVLRSIEYAYERGCRLFIAGGAIGFDTIAARQVILFRMTHPDVRLTLLLPCRNQDEKWSHSDRDAYNYVLSVADTVEYLADEYTDDCMRLRNMELASRCDILIAYVCRDRSGTAQTIRMAKGLGKEVYNIYPRLEEENN